MLELTYVGSRGRQFLLKGDVFTKDLIDTWIEMKRKEYDALRLHNILNTIVIEARRDLNPSHARRVEEAHVRYRFYAPPKSK